MSTNVVRARERFVEWTRAQARLEALGATRQPLLERARVLEERVGKEAVDVERLQRLSLSALFHTVLGDKVEAISKERRELLAAELERDGVRERLADLERQRAVLQARIAELSDAALELQRAMDAASEAVLARGGSAADELRALNEHGDDLRERRLQLLEAESAAERAARVFDDVDESLTSARSWGTFDLLGGGLIATSVKHARLDDARVHLGRARSAIATLERELDDVRSLVRPEEYDLQIEGGLKAADYLFDGLIVDWIVQKRIDESVERTRRLKSRITCIGGELLTERKGVDVELVDVEARTRALLGDSGA
jgi:DNA repair exonuclease SbcCD ATPase subunit